MMGFDFRLPDGSLMEMTKVYPLDIVYDTLEDVPKDVKSNKHYAGSSKWTVKEIAKSVKEDFGTIDIFVHSLANKLEVCLFAFMLCFFSQ
ncbi:hypothetical protein LguiA_001295 [Lonicera macranthoides]